MPTQVQLFKNNVETILAADLLNGVSSLTVPTGHGARFPTPSVDEYLVATLFEKDAGGNEINYETVKCTTVSGDTLSGLTRDFELNVLAETGVSGGRTYPSGVGINPSGVTYIELRWTAHAANNHLSKSGNLLGLENNATARTNLGLGSMATQAASAVAITGGTIAGVTMTSLDANTTIQDNVDPTKQVRFEASSVSPSSIRVMTVPDASGTLVLHDAAQTLTNKTISAANNTITTAATGNLAATTLNAALAELESEKAALAITVTKDSSTGAAQLPVGTQAQRPTGAAGLIRFNDDLDKFEGHNGTTWSSVGGGATGGGSDEVFVENGQVVTADYTIPAGRNANSVGPITINSGITVTVSSGSIWSVI